jgi:predicted amidohydrolase YtcJ
MRSRVWIGALLTLLAAALLLPAAASAANKPADTVFKNGDVYTVNPGDRTAQAVAVRDGEIVYVGSNRGANAFVGPSTKVVKLGGKMMLPGFIDSHAHASFTGRLLFSVVLNGVYGTLQTYLDDIRAFAEANPSFAVIRGSGWSNSSVPDIGPLATDLDTAVPDRPASIMSEDGHSYWVNTKALKLAGVTGATPDPVGGKIERLAGTEQSDPPYGTPSGTLRETAANLVNDKLPDYTVEQYKEGILYFQENIAGPAGITTVFDPMFDPARPNAVQAYEELAQAGQLAIRVRGALWLKPTDDLGTWLAAAKAERAKHTTPMFRINAVKVFADGVVEGHTAYLKAPYADALAYAGDAGYRGDPIWAPKAMAAAFTAVDKAGFQIHVHAIGDAATTEVLDALALARKANGPHDWRPGITHLQLVDPSDYKRFAKLGVTAVPDPYWFEKDDYYTYLQVPYLGQPRADHEYPMKSFFDTKVLVASASDFPVTPTPNPIYGIGAGVTRWFPFDLVHEYPAWPLPGSMLWPEEAVTVDQMIRSFSINGAGAYYLEKTTGSIKVGKSADLIVLDQNLFQIAPDQIFGVNVLFTMSHGAVLHDAL